MLAGDRGDANGNCRGLATSHDLMIDYRGIVSARHLFTRILALLSVAVVVPRDGG
jgi:hypothetical protein